MSKVSVPHSLDDALNALDPAVDAGRDASSFRGIIAAREQVVEAEAALQQAVAEARQHGDSWTIIGAALDTTRQAAYQRFGQRKS